MKKWLAVILAALVICSAGLVAGADYSIEFAGELDLRQAYAGNSLRFDIAVRTFSEKNTETLGLADGEQAPYIQIPSFGFPGTGADFASYLAGAPSHASLGFVPFHNMHLTATPPEGWTVTLSKESFIMSEDDLEELQVRVSIPSSANPGMYSVMLTVDADIGAVTAELPIQVMEPFDVTITNYTITPESPRLGDEVTFRADVTVIGDIDIPEKQVALYINELGQAKIAYQTLDLMANSSQTVSITWTATDVGLLTTRLYVNPTANETSTSNNQIQDLMQVLPAEDPCALADQVYEEALLAYEEDCAAATSQLTIAKALYEQCGNTFGVANCDMLMDQCEQYALADDLMEQGDAFADAGDCTSAIEKWNAAKDIYEGYADQAMVDSIDSKISSCVDEPAVVDTDPFYVRYWWAIALAVIAVLAVAAFALRRKNKLEEQFYPSYADHREGDDSGLLGAEFERELDPREALLAEMEGREPMRPQPAGTIPEAGDVTSFITGLDDALVKLTPEAIKEHLKESVHVYGRIIEKRNELIPEMDEKSLAKIDARIHELAERIFRVL